MAKGKLLQDTFEQLAELGTSTAQKTVKSMAQIVNPFPANESNASNESNKSHSPENNGKNNHTPLDFDKLKNNFQDNEKAKVEGLRNRLFQMVKTEEERSLIRKRQEEMQKKRQESYDKQQKDKNEQKKREQQSSGIAHGKLKGDNAQRRKAAAAQQQAEVKPSTGKQ